MWPEQMEERCPGAHPVGVAGLAGHRFLINERGVATVVPEAANEVLGVLWAVSDAHIDALDGFEGLVKGNYVRESVWVTARDTQVESWIYVACHSQPSSPRPGYLERVIDGATHFGLDASYVDDQLRPWAGEAT